MINRAVFSKIGPGCVLLGLTCLGSVGLPLLLPSDAQAQSGFVLFGSDELQVLDYRLDFGGQRRRLERYRLDIPAQDVAVAEIQIEGDDHFNGKFNPEEVRLEVEGEPVALREVYWNPEFNSLEVIIEDPVSAGQDLRLVLSNVRNPDAGTFRFRARLLGTEANPLYRLIGHWIITIDEDRS